MSDNPKNMSSTSIEELALANHDFSLSLYTELAKKETGNLFYSPFSIHVIMFMASVGAASETLDEIMATLNLNKTANSLKVYKELLEELTEENDCLKLATGMFVDSLFTVKPSFVSETTNYLKSSMEKLNFKTDPERQRQYINDWVSNKTNDKIKGLFAEGSIDEDTMLVLANAVHFKSGWIHKFDEAQDEPFYLTSSNQITVKMMNLKHDLPYYHDDDLKFAAIELPYERRTFKMMILLPDDKDGLKDLENNILKIKLCEISSKMTDYKVTVKLPRFKLEQSLELKETLSNLGCPTMFSRNANFSNIVEENSLCVGKVVHKAFIDVNEKGTEAAAATGMTMVLRCMIPIDNDEVEFLANHPFIFFITGRNDELLFAGRVQNLPKN